MEQQPLLTKDQLIDWLIYHVPMEESIHEDRPFALRYKPRLYMGCNTVFGANPWELYEEMAESMMRNIGIHREITDLYWYWTIELEDEATRYVDFMQSVMTRNKIKVPACKNP